MEHVYPTVPDTDIRQLYLNEAGKGRVAYFPGDIDRSFWQVLCADHGKLLGNTFKWALNEELIAGIEGPGVIDVTAWQQENSMTVHLVNLTNPMLMKGPFRELIPVSLSAKIKIPENLKVYKVHLLVSGKEIPYELKEGKIAVNIPQILDQEIIGIDFK
jgi:hypothetical protein